MKCPVCSKEFSQAEMYLFQENPNGNLYHATCEACFAAVFISEKINKLGVVHIGILTDVAVQDVYRFSQNEPVCADDVLNVYELLNEYKGDVSALVER